MHKITGNASYVKFRKSVRFVDVFDVAGMDAAHLDLKAFTKVLLGTEGSVAFMHCRYDNAIATDWYFHERKLVNTSNGR